MFEDLTGLKVKKSSLKIAGKWIGSSLTVAVLSAAVFAHAAMAQDSQPTQQNFNNQQQAAPEEQVQAIDGGSSGEQLPNGFAQEQIPQSFSMGDEAAAVPASDQIIPSPAQNAAADDVTQQPEDVPAQPEAQKLVPSTPMGTAAQAISKNNQTSGNPVEEAAARADAEIQAQRNAAPASEDVLEKYTAAANDDGSGDALPAVNTLNMVSLEGDFPNSNKKVSVNVDGALSPEESKELQESIRQEAFDAAITGMFPLSPEQIQKLLGKYDETQRAVKTPPYKGPKPEISVTNISLDPGVMPPTIKTAVGNVTTMNILDATGAPWPVQDVTWAGDFEIVEPESGGHIIRITPMSEFARGNIVIRLLTLKTPLTLTLETSRDVVQYRVDARVPEYGPFASAPLMQGGKSMVAGDSTLTALLDGVAPGGMVKLDVAGVDGRTTAYAMNGSTYVRTPLTLLSPAWQSSVSSADGMNVYVLSSAPVLLLSDEGEFLRATLNEKEDLLDE